VRALPGSLPQKLQEGALQLLEMHIELIANSNCLKTLATNAGCADLRDQLEIRGETEPPVHRS
jgi:hypothetical protein